MHRINKISMYVLVVIFVIITWSCTATNSGQNEPKETAGESNETTQESSSNSEPHPIIPPPGEEVDLPDGWPDSIPIMDGLILIDVFNENELGKNYLSVIANGNVNIDEVTNFYNELDGWKRDWAGSQETTGDQRMLNLVKEDNDTEKVMILIGLHESGLTFIQFFYREDVTDNSNENDS
ncbi:MAG: hypothetical protein NTY09_14915 [bacterium]|nr:hypothetical protein [bacterium]